MNTLLGASWKTSVAGYLVIVFGMVQTGIAEQGLPHDWTGWLKLLGYIITGVALRLAKDGDVSNAPKPLAQSAKVT